MSESCRWTLSTRGGGRALRGFVRGLPPTDSIDIRVFVFGPLYLGHLSIVSDLTNRFGALERSSSPRRASRRSSRPLSHRSTGISTDAGRGPSRRGARAARWPAPEPTVPLNFRFVLSSSLRSVFQRPDFLEDRSFPNVLATVSAGFDKTLIDRS